ncbi:MAG: thiamine diphosphokinase, partial [Bacillales bacterium]|nr:thiamine diphosphokinase [Bacillales bacterium]
MRIGIVAGGPKEELPNLSKISNIDYWVGVDRGISYLLDAEIEPEIIFGDYDSLFEHHLEYIKNHKNSYKYNSEKDESDLELAIKWSLEQKPKNIHIFGATGGRIDHMLGNIGLLALSVNTEIPVYIIDKLNMLTLIKNGKTVINKSPEYKYISFLPFTEIVTGITLNGFKYPLLDYDLFLGSTRCISNELVEEECTISFN